MDPLILTLELDDASFARLDALRRAHFPPDRNMIPAHLTLFHHLPGTRLSEIAEILGETSEATPPLPFTATGVMAFPQGAAIRLVVPGLEALRRDLSARLPGERTPQDRKALKPHVTVQNKVDPEHARETVAALSAGFTPWDGVATGVLLWHYRGGPWDAAGRFEFTGETT